MTWPRRLDTDVGPQWIGAPGIWNGTATGGLPGTKGEGVIIGVLDTGINMDHPSFADIGGDGFNHTNPFGAGNYKGWCNPAHPNYNPAYVCNDKLVGAWDYADASWGETDGPEDNDGHGSHTASTSGGNYLAAGHGDSGRYPYSPAISGVAPHANIIAYDVCGPDGSCYNTDVVAALNQAILDGVDVTNESIGIGGNTWTGAKQAAYLSVFNAGITSARSAGNSGPGASTVGSTPPWVITVGANTHNRAGTNAVTNLSGGSTAPPGGGTLNGLGSQAVRRSRPSSTPAMRLQRRAVPQPLRCQHRDRHDRDLRPRHQRARGQGLERAARRRGRHDPGQHRRRPVAQRRPASPAGRPSQQRRRRSAQDLAGQWHGHQGQHRRHDDQLRRQQRRHHGRL